MPRKIRQLRSDLRSAGFVLNRKRGKGSHTVWEHPDVGAALVTVSGQDGADAKPYQEKDVREAIELVQRARRATE